MSAKATKKATKKTVIRKSKCQPMLDLRKAYEALMEKAEETYQEEVQKIVNKYNVHLGTDRESTIWMIREPREEDWTVATDESPPHPIFAELDVIDDIAHDVGGIGPAYMEYFTPVKQRRANGNTDR